MEPQLSAIHYLACFAAAKSSNPVTSKPRENTDSPTNWFLSFSSASTQSWRLNDGGQDSFRCREKKKSKKFKQIQFKAILVSKIYSELYFCTKYNHLIFTWNKHHLTYIFNSQGRWRKRWTPDASLCRLWTVFFISFRPGTASIFGRCNLLIRRLGDRLISISHEAWYRPTAVIYTVLWTIKLRRLVFRVGNLQREALRRSAFDIVFLFTILLPNTPGEIKKVSR